MTFKEFMKLYFNIDILGDNYQNKSEKLKRYYKIKFLTMKETEEESEPIR